MSERQTLIEQLLIEEFSRDGYACFEYQGKTYARLTLEDAEVLMSEVCLSRLAGEIERGLERRKI